jgi:gliding motility-associated-like protein
MLRIPLAIFLFCSIFCKGQNIIKSNVFTPNGDQINDVFDFSSLNLAEQTITVYDRWGAEVFRSSQYLQVWDGKNKGQAECPSGVYFFTLSFKEFINKKADQKGFIQLIR